MRYWACGRDADALDGQKNVRDVENAPKAAPYPQVQCTLHALLGVFLPIRLTAIKKSASIKDAYAHNYFVAFLIFSISLTIS